jgi:hypothetical protein
MLNWGEGIQMLGSVCSDVILSHWASTLPDGDMQRFSQLFWEVKASWNKEGSERNPH